MDMDRATDFQISSIMVDEQHEIQGLFISLELFENVFTSTVTGTISCLETASNQFLAENQIEGNEKISFRFGLPSGEELSFEGYINRISNRTLSTNGQSTYNIEFTSAFVRENEQIDIYKRYQDTSSESIVEDAYNRIYSQSEIEGGWDKKLGEGEPMNFISNGWSPLRVINYVMEYGVPQMQGGQTTVDKETEQKEHKSQGRGGFLFWETSKGHRFGTVSQLLRGELGEVNDSQFEYTLANQGAGVDITRNHILSFNNVQNNDTQTLQRSGAFKSKMTAFNMDTGVYTEQIWESDMATEKQKKTSKQDTRTFVTTLTNERWNAFDQCAAEQSNSKDTKLKTMQQTAGTYASFQDNICQYTLPIRQDINAGDRIKTQIYEAGVDSAGRKDEKYSGEWIVSSVGHHISLDPGAAYTRLTCIRPTDKQTAYTESQSSMNKVI